MIELRLVVEESTDHVKVSLDSKGAPPVEDREADYTADLLTYFWKALKKIESETQKSLVLEGPEGFWEQAASLNQPD